MRIIAIELPDGARHSLEAPDGFGGSLATLLAERGFPLNTRCAQRGLCRGCEVDVRTGRLPLIAGGEAGPGRVKACQAGVAAAELSVPPRSLLEHLPQVGETFRLDAPCGHRPLFEPYPKKRDTGFAVDIGTTTVVVLVVDLVTGEPLGRAGAFNAQIRFGDNVLTRIDAAAGRPAVVEQLRRAVVDETIAPLLLRACERAGRPPARLAGGTVAGNTTMLHLLAGEDPAPLGVAPFTPRFLERRCLTAAEIGLVVETEGGTLAPGTELHLLPGLAAYVGADIVAGILATGMAYDPEPCLLVDIGTNGEIVLQRDGRLTACATAAGPAFEGSGLRCGTRAREGAVSGMTLSETPFAVAVETIGGLPLVRSGGICGSAYLDFMAEGRRSGLLTDSGRFEPDFWIQIPEAWRQEDEDGRALRLGPAPRDGGLVIGEADVALLLQAKAAIGAGIETLLEATGLRAADIARIHLAGGFGMHLKLESALAIGLLPGLEAARVSVVGNSALAGAYMSLVDTTVLEEMEGLRERVEVVELNLADGFEDCFIDHLLLP
ncbi:MAG: DUF4445 domain-containing protein [Puniceicoccaceae bacterium]|nr:MAG: DUF4445 domain-containing protein [Puniceicoccaceae bacterium]